MLIYRFDPPGARNLGDLKSLKNKILSLEQIKTAIPVIAHDQEPLNWLTNSMAWSEFRDQFYLQRDTPVDSPLRQARHNETFWTWLSSMNLASVLFGQTIADKCILLHSEKNSDQVKMFESCHCKPVYWFSHAVISLDWYRYAAVDSSLKFDFENFVHDFNVYARAWRGTREYRLKFLDLMIDNELEVSSRITFNQIDQEHYESHLFENSQFIPLQNLDKLDSYNVPSWASASYSTEHYNSCMMDVVLETLFDDTRIHLTEKTFRPIACGKPFILVSTPGALKLLKSYGFQTFAPFIDESYDDISDPIDRLTAVVQEMRRIKNLPREQKKHWAEQCHAIAAQNKNYFFSQTFFDKILGELKTNLFAAIEHIHAYHRNGTHMFTARKLMGKNLRLPTSSLTVQEQINLINLCRQHRRSCQYFRPIARQEGKL